MKNQASRVFRASAILVAVVGLTGCSVTDGVVKIDAPGKKQKAEEEKGREKGARGDADGSSSAKSGQEPSFETWDDCYEIYRVAAENMDELNDDNWRPIRDFDLSEKDLSFIEHAEEAMAAGQRCEEVVGKEKEPPNASFSRGMRLYQTRDGAKEEIAEAKKLVAKARKVYEPIQGMSNEEVSAYLEAEDQHYPNYEQEFEKLSRLYKRLRQHHRYTEGWKEKYLRFPEAISAMQDLQEVVPGIAEKIEPFVELQRFTAYDKHDRHIGRVYGRVGKMNQKVVAAQSRLERMEKRKQKVVDECKTVRRSIGDQVDKLIKTAVEEEDLRALMTEKHERIHQRHPSDLSRKLAHGDFCSAVLAKTGEDVSEFDAKLAKWREKAESTRKAVNQRMIAEAEAPEDTFEGSNGASARALISRLIVEDHKFPEGGEVTRVYLQRKNWDRSSGTRWNKVNNAFERYDYSYIFAQVAVDIGDGKTAIYNVDMFRYHIDKEDSLDIRSKAYVMLTENL